MPRFPRASGSLPRGQRGPPEAAGGAEEVMGEALQGSSVCTELLGGGPGLRCPRLTLDHHNAAHQTKERARPR